MINFVVRKHAAVYTLSVLILVIGVVSYVGLPKEASPEIKQPYIFVTTVYPGVAAKDVENLVTRPIETELDGLEGLEDLSSSSQQSLSFIFATFSSSMTVERALQKVRERVDIARAQLPADVDEPVVREFSSSDWPIFIVSLSHPEGVEVIEKASELLEDELRRVKGVLDVDIAGRLEQEISIELDPVKLERYEFSINDVIMAVQSSNIAIPGGILKNSAKNYTISVNAEIRNPREFENVIVKSGPVKVHLRDIARVRFVGAEPETYSRVNGDPCITLSVKKRSGQNIIDIVDETKLIIEKLKPQFPAGTQVDYISDQSRYVRQIVADLENNMFTGFMLVMIVTIFFLGLVNSLFVSLAIPFSMLLSFFVLDMMGITLNMVVLFSLILALGMLVDNGIVIVENIFRHGTMGKTKMRAAIDGAEEVAWPIIASTITTCLAFFPIVFMPDVMGDFMSYLPKTVIVVLASSLFVALTINPVFCAGFLRIDERSRKKMVEGGGFFGRLQSWYTKRIKSATKHPVYVLASSFVVVVLGFILYFAMGKEMVFFGTTDPIEAVVSVELPQGTPLRTTDSLVREVEKIANRTPASLDNIQATVGRSGSGEMFAGIGEEFNKGYVRLVFKPFLERKIKGKTTMIALQDSLEGVTGAEIIVRAEENGPPSGHDVSYEIVGSEYAVMGRFADSILTVLSRYDALKLIDTDYEAAKPEIAVTVNRVKAAFHGLSVQEVAGTIRNAINGSTIGSFRQGEEEYDITLRYGRESRNAVPSLRRLHLVNHDGLRIPLVEVADVAINSSVGVIKRRGLERSVGVWGDFHDDVQNKDVIKKEIDGIVRGMMLPRGYEVTQGEGEEMRAEAMQFLMKAFIIAVFLIVVVLVAQFNSITQPVIIISSVFLSLGGVFWGYFLSGQEFVVIMSGIGCIALAGVAVNNCIVLVDYTNILIRDGMKPADAVIEAGRTRLRPVLLTAITTVLGLLPMAFGVSIDIHPGSFGLQVGSESSEFWRAFAWAMIYGLTFATVMTLVVVPSMLALNFKLFPPKEEEFGKEPAME